MTLCTRYIREINFNPMRVKTLSFRNLILDVLNEASDGHAGTHKRLIKGISGEFNSGRLSVIMGISGSGKTSLINLLSGRINSGSRTHGQVLFDGAPRDPRRWLRQMAFLEQDDWIVSGQTVREYIHFQISCRIMLYERKAINTLVHKIMNDLHITHIKDTKLENISGGERKRVMIAVELALEPEVLILDEPTTGLDSHLALELVFMAKKYAAEQNKIVVMTVHQPGSAMFEMFDDLMFVHEGVSVYLGPVSEMEPFFSSLGILRIEGLSKPEFLFELFSETSVFPSYMEYKPVVKAMTERAAEGGHSEVGHRQLKDRNDSVVLFHFQPSNALLLFKRILVLDWRHLKLQKLVVIEALYLAFFCVGRFYMELGTALSDAGMEGVTIPGNMLALSRKRFGDHCFSSVCEAVSHSLYLFPLMLTLVSPRSAMPKKDYLSRESEKGVYTAVTLYFAVVLSDFFYGIIRGLIFVVILAALGLGPGFTPSLIYFIFAGLLLATVLMAFFKCLTPSKILHTTLISALKIGLVFFGRPYSVCQAVKAMSNTPVADLKHLSLLWCHLPHEIHVRAGLTRRLLSKETDEEYDRFIRLILKHPELELSSSEIVKAEKLCLLDGRYHDNFLLLALLFSMSLTSVLSILLLTRRFSPKLRLALSR
jgi:ATP-binding cassette, subfamily G (WHITE), member 1